MEPIKLGCQYKKYRTILLSLSFIVTIFYLLTASFYFAGGAGSFFTYAKSIVFGGHTLDIAQRSVGFPLMVILSGFPWHESIIGITLIHGIMAVLIPYFVFASIGPAFPRLAFFAGIFCILSLVPYLTIKIMYHDQTYTFFLTLSVLMFSQFTRTKSIRYFYLLSFVMLITSLTRPAGNYAYILIVACAFLIYPKLLKHYIICSLIFSAMLFLNNEHRRMLMDVKPHEPVPSYTGHQIMFNIYNHASEWGIHFSTAMGPAFERIYQEIIQNFGPNPSQHPRLLTYKDTFPEFYENALNIQNPDVLAQAMFNKSLPEYFDLLHSMPNIAFDSRLFLQAAWEVVKQYPTYPLAYTVRNLKYYFFNPGYTTQRHSDSILMARTGLDYIPQIAHIAIEPGLTNKARKEMSYLPLKQHFSFLKSTETIVHKIWRKLYYLINKITVYFILFGLVGVILYQFILRKKINASHYQTDIAYFTGPMLGSFVLLFYNAFITSLTVDPIFRYHYMTMPIQIISAFLGLGIMYFLLSRFFTRIPV